MTICHFVRCLFSANHQEARDKSEPNTLTLCMWHALSYNKEENITINIYKN